MGVSLSRAQTTVEEAMSAWQGQPGAIRAACREISENPNLKHAAILLAALDAAPDLPVGTIVWRVTPRGTALDPNFWMPVSETSEGARAFRARSGFRRATIHKITITTRGVRAMRIEADPAYAHEQEMLLMPGILIVETRPIANGYMEHDVCAPGAE